MYEGKVSTGTDESLPKRILQAEVRALPEPIMPTWLTSPRAQQLVPRSHQDGLVDEETVSIGGRNNTSF